MACALTVSTAKYLLVYAGRTHIPQGALLSGPIYFHIGLTIFFRKLCNKSADRKRDWMGPGCNIHQRGRNVHGQHFTSNSSWDIPPPPPPSDFSAMVAARCAHMVILWYMLFCGCLLGRRKECGAT